MTETKNHRQRGGEGDMSVLDEILQSAKDDVLRPNDEKRVRVRGPDEAKDE